MPKTPAFIVDMKSHPRSMKHGKHRRTSPPAHGSPVDGASAGTGRADAYDYPRALLKPFDLSPGAVNTVDPGVVADHLTYIANLLDQMNKELYGDIKLSTISHAGIHLGEIIGRRLWFVCGNGMLHSLAHDYIWGPGETESGDVDKIVENWCLRPIYGGVYAFKLDEGEIEKEWNYSKHGLFETDRSPRHSHLIGLAMGTIKMWGEVVEHDRGYRAQFAKVLTIDRTFYHSRPPDQDPVELYCK